MPRQRDQVKILRHDTLIQRQHGIQGKVR